MADQMMTAGRAEFLRHAVRERHNILIAAGTSTGKTTLANALLAEIAATGDRVLVLEDTVELQCAARDHTFRCVPARRGVDASAPRCATPGSRRRRSAWRRSTGSGQGLGHRPSRWHRHDSCRLRAWAHCCGATDLEVAVNPPRALIAEAVNVVIHIAGRGRKRHVETIARVVGFDGAGFHCAGSAASRTADGSSCSRCRCAFLDPDQLGELP